MAQKTTTNGAKARKKTVPKKQRPAVKKTAPKKASDKETGVNRNSLYVLIIMLLLTVIFFMLSRLFGPGNIIKKSSIEKEQGPHSISLYEQKNEAKNKNNTDTPGEEQDNTRAVKEKVVKIYLLHYDTAHERMVLLPKKRRIEGESALKGAIEALVKGPTPGEKRRGALTAVPRGLIVKSVRVKKKTAVIDFNSAVESGAGGTILLHRLDQIVYTATQFRGIDSVIITINGKRKRSLGSDGISASGPLRRRRQ